MNEEILHRLQQHFEITRKEIQKEQPLLPFLDDKMGRERGVLTISIPANRKAR